MIQRWAATTLAAFGLIFAAAHAQSPATTKTTTAAAKGSSPDARKPITPKPGSDLRSDILDSLRENVELSLNRGVEPAYNQRVKFLVDKIQVLDGQAFVIARPIRHNGQSIHWKISAYKKRATAPDFVERVVALMEKKTGKRYWKPLGYNLGTAGKIWSDWSKRYNAPAGLIPN